MKSILCLYHKYLTLIDDIYGSYLTYGNYNQMFAGVEGISGIWHIVFGIFKCTTTSGF